MGDFVEIGLGSSFLLNAGIVGLLKLLEKAEAEKGVDYIVESQKISVKKNFFEEQDVAQLYIRTIVDNFEKGTKFHHIMEKKTLLDNLLADTDLSPDKIKQIKQLYKEFADMLLKSSFKAGYEILKLSDSPRNISVDDVEKLKKTDDVYQAKKIYDELVNICNDRDVRDVLAMKDIMYSKLNMFYEGTSFFLPANLKKSIKDCYKKDFVDPLLEELNSTKKKTKRCIECSGMSNLNKSISFMIDTTDDVARKKSHYWNCKPDAFACPMCTFLYILAPLGFEFCGSDAVFINNNSSIEDMSRWMSTYRIKQEEAKTASLAKLYRVFTSEGIEMIMRDKDMSWESLNVQVVVRKKNNTHYEMQIVSKDIIRTLKNGVQYLKHLESKYVKMGDEFLSVYDEVLKNILSRTNQYVLIHRLIINDIKDNKNTNYIFNIVNLQLCCKGGNRMEENKNNRDVDIAFTVGKKLREDLTRDIRTDKDKDNSLRSVVYKLSNTLLVKNTEMFLDTVIRIYSGKGLPIPAVFKNCYNSEEALQSIGYSFILGLKYVKYEKASEEESKNE